MNLDACTSIGFLCGTNDDVQTNHSSTLLEPSESCATRTMACVFNQIHNISINSRIARNERRLTGKTLFNPFGHVGDFRQMHSGLRVQWVWTRCHTQEFGAPRTTTYRQSTFRRACMRRTFAPSIQRHKCPNGFQHISMHKRVA